MPWSHRRCVLLVHSARILVCDARGERHDLKRVVHQVLIERVAGPDQASSLGGRSEQHARLVCLGTVASKRVRISGAQRYLLRVVCESCACTGQVCPACRAIGRLQVLLHHPRARLARRPSARQRQYPAAVTFVDRIHRPHQAAAASPASPRSSLRCSTAASCRSSSITPALAYRKPGR